MKKADYRWLILLALIAGTVYYFMPRLGELSSVGTHLKNANIILLGSALVAFLATYVASSFVVLGATRRILPFTGVLTLQLASSFVNKVTPKGIGGVALIERYLEKASHNRLEATSSVLLIYSSGITVHLSLLIFVSIFGPYSLDLTNLSLEQIYLVAIIVLLGFLSVLLSYKFIKKIQSWVKVVLKSIKYVFTTPVKFAELFGGSAAITLFNVISLYFALLAIGASVSFGTVLFVFLAAFVVAAAAPTPAGFGAVEAALAVGLSATGTELSQALAGVLLYRLISFWLPIIPGIFAFRHLLKQKIV